MSEPLFPSIESFYALRGGARSGESDCGVWWTGPRPFPRYRVSVVHDTGDVYAIDEIISGVVELLATLEHDCTKHDGVTRHPPTCAYTIADERLGDLRTMHASNSLAWAREHLRG